MTVVVVFNDKLPRGAYPLIPAEEYSLCLNCHADARFVNKAVDAHATVRSAGRWASALIVFDNGETHKVKNPADIPMQA